MVDGVWVMQSKAWHQLLTSSDCLTAYVAYHILSIILERTVVSMSRNGNHLQTRCGAKMKCLSGMVKQMVTDYSHLKK